MIIIVLQFNFHVHGSCYVDFFKQKTLIGYNTHRTSLNTIPVVFQVQRTLPYNVGPYFFFSTTMQVLMYCDVGVRFFRVVT